jgi:phage shock protein PspC (stress-responsive transcriptional regulator)
MREKVVGGVCAGFADYLNIELTLMRIIWLTVAIFTGVGFIAYVICWIVMPRDYELLPEPAARASEPESTRAAMAQNEAEAGSSSA